jgi:hypothetical protein
MGTLPALPPAARGVSAFVGVGHREVRYRADGGHLPTARR